MQVIGLTRQPYALGLDIGSTSIGWACLSLRASVPAGIIASGVRRFDAGMSGSSLDFERGKEESNAVARRQARLARRQIRRRASRRWRVFRLLQQAGLLPAETVPDRPAISPFIEKLDAELRPKFLSRGDHVSAQLLVYKIRAAAAQGKVDPFALGRAFLHLAKRRGFNSNLRGAPKDDEETGTVKPAIKSLAADLAAANATLGEFFASRNPLEKRIRQRWTGREMYLREFERICETQRQFHPQLTDEFCKQLKRAIFFQRPLKSSKGLVGKCSIDPKRTRLAAAHPLAQEVRMLQFVNNVRILPKGQLERRLNDREREFALAALSQTGKMKLKDFRDAIGLNTKTDKLNFEGDDDSHARGLGTIAELRTILGKRWDELSSADQERLFYEVLSFTKRDALIRRAQNVWRFSQQQAELLAELTLEPGYSNHSRHVLEKLREKLARRDERTGEYPTYAEAKLLAFPDAHEASPVCDRLPPVIHGVANLRSPAVIRALTEVRKVVNELMARFGKPERIHIELARDLKKSKKERKKAEDLIKEQTDRRRKALQKIRAEFTSYPEKPGYDRGIEMYLLAEECDWTCPYTGEPIRNVRDLIGDNSRFDVEHIFPRRHLDDSFGNKTLCLHDENRHVKRDRLPAIAYADNPAKYQDILSRVKKFKGPASAKKLARFLVKEVPEGFAERQLNETRHTTVAAAEYLGLLYGGRTDDEGKQRIFTLTGGLTALLRGQWKLNQILGISDEKNRADHRQHAVDAIVAACTDMGTIHKLQSAAASAWERNSSRFPTIDPPWTGLLDEARKSVLGILVSHRQHRRLNGPLHADTNYSPAATVDGKAIHKVRKPLESLSETEISGDAIVDPVIRALVQAKYAELKETSKAKKPKEAFASLINHPCIPPKTTGSGRPTPIHSVRIWARQKASPVRQGDMTRVVSLDSNFCTRILAVLDKDGREVGWTDSPIPLLDAIRKKGKNENDPLLKFTLFAKEHVLMPDAAGDWQVYVVLNFSKGEIGVQLHYDGRKRDEVRKSDKNSRIFAGVISERRFRKVDISPTGLLTDALTGEPIDLATLAKWQPGKQTAKQPKRKKGS